MGAIVCGIGLGMLSVLSVMIRPANSADRIYLSYGLLERSIPVASLETYAKTGKIDDDLAVYARYADPKQLAQLRQILLARIPLNAVAVSQFLYSPIGERLLEQLGDVIQMDSRQSGFYALRAALILAAADPNGFTPIGVLRKFPSHGIDINLNRSLQLAGTLEDLVNQTNQAVALVNQQSNLEASFESLPASPLPSSLEQRGPFTWTKQTIQLKDTSRDRTFPADIYLPRTDTPRPLIVISHGLGSDRFSFAYLAQQLASYGFAVAVPEHPGSNAKQLQALLSGRAADVTSPREFIDRPLDIKFLLNVLTDLSRTDPTYRGHLNLQQVGVVGQSYGGYTALALAGAPINWQQLQTNCQALNNSLNVSLLLQCLALQLPREAYQLADPRIKAAIAIDPVNSSIMGQTSISQIKIPIMIVAGSADTIAPALPEQIQPFTWLTTPDKYLVLINSGTHFSTIAESPDAAVPVPDAVVGPTPALAQRYMRALSVPFFLTYIANQPQYRPYLSAAYTDRISQPPLTLSLTQTLTTRQVNQAIGAAPVTGQPSPQTATAPSTSPTAP